VLLLVGLGWGGWIFESEGVGQDIAFAGASEKIFNKFNKIIIEFVILRAGS
jgi:hypothetical protein